MPSSRKRENYGYVKIFNLLSKYANSPTAPSQEDLQSLKDNGFIPKATFASLLATFENMGGPPQNLQEQLSKVAKKVEKDTVIGPGTTNLITDTRPGVIKTQEQKSFISDLDKLLQSPTTDKAKVEELVSNRGISADKLRALVSQDEARLAAYRTSGAYATRVISGPRRSCRLAGEKRDGGSGWRSSVTNKVCRPSTS